MKKIRIFIWKFFVFWCEIFYIFEQACFRNDIGMTTELDLIQMKLTSIERPNVLNQHPATLNYLLGDFSSVIGDMLPTNNS